MAAKVDLYNSSYGNYALDAYSEIRVETEATPTII